MLRFALYLAASNLLSVRATTRPVVGILSQEVKPWDESGTGWVSYISASYVKAVEAAGARAAPVFIDRNRSYYEDLAEQMNGFLFPGGAADITSKKGYARSAKIVYDIAMSMNAAGKVMPILGVCLGMEVLSLLSADGVDQRTPCPVKNEALNLNFLPDFRNSSLYANASEQDILTLSTTNSTSNHHRQCITSKTLSDHNVLDKWKVLSTSKGAKSDTFISSMELRNVPVVAIIFHPEKNAYEWKSSQANPHDARSIAGVRLFYDWLVVQARLSNNSFRSDEIAFNTLIYNYNPVFTGRLGKYDYQTYYFNS